MSLSGEKAVDIDQDIKTDTSSGSTNETPSTQPPPGSLQTSASTSYEFDSIDVNEIIRTPDSVTYTTSSVLNYCKCKLLRPYLHLLGLVGLRPMTVDRPERWSCTTILGHLQSLATIVLLLAGYALQYLACFRRDRGFCYKAVTPNYSSTFFEIKNSNDSYALICYGSFVFSYLLPSLFHFFGYVYSVFLFRISDNEQLQNLIERVFVLCCGPSESSCSPRRLLRTLWCYIAISLVWMTCSGVCLGFMAFCSPVMFQWVEHWPDFNKFILRIALVFTSVWQDLAQVTVVTSYCLQTQLLKCQLVFLRDRLLRHTIKPLDWMREICEFRKLLRHINEGVAPAVCLFTMINISWACAGIVWLLNYDVLERGMMPLIGVNIFNVVLWVLISIAPFIQAARLTTACGSIQSVGHEIRIRPFVHQDTSGEDLSTILLFASTLKMRAKLFRVPVTGRYLCLAVTILAISLLTLGMCHFLQ